MTWDQLAPLLADQARPLVWLAVGDSAAAGAGSSDPGARWTARAVRMLRGDQQVIAGAGTSQQTYLPARHNIWPLADWPAPATITGTTYPAEWAPTFGHRGIGFTAPGGQISWTVDQADTAELWFVSGDGYAPLTVTVDGGAPVTVAVPTSYSVARSARLLLGSAGPHTVTVNCAGNGLVAGLSVSSSGAPWHLYDDAAPDYSTSRILAALSQKRELWQRVAPDLVTVQLAEADAAAGVEVELYGDQLGALLVELAQLPSAPAVLVLTTPTPVGWTVAGWSAWSAAAELAAASSGAELLDLAALMARGDLTDARHQLAAELVAGRVLSLAAPPTPPDPHPLPAPAALRRYLRVSEQQSSDTELSDRLAAARELLDQLDPARLIPAQLRHDATVEVAAELWRRRESVNGAQQLTVLDGQPVRAPRDPLATVRPMLAPWLVPF